MTGEARRTDAEIRREIERWKAEQLRFRGLGVKHGIEALAAAIIVGALAWTIGDVPTPTTRVKVP